MATRNEKRSPTLGTGLELRTLAGMAYHMITAGLAVSLMALGFMVLLGLASQSWVMVPVFALYLVSLPTLVRLVGVRTRRELLRTLGKVPPA